ncbi:MAG: hypothetical protein M3P40_09600 [Actinomycetota bacterium]|nr:hypothetical protein [Actinomycetota bacterium]
MPEGSFHLAPTPWARISLLDEDGRRLRVEAPLGLSGPRSGIHHVDVEEDPERVVITLVRRVLEPPHVRFDTGFPEYADVELQATLGDRVVYDGAAAEVRPQSAGDRGL